jgi:hypothetical protein
MNTNRKNPSVYLLIHLIYFFCVCSVTYDKICGFSLTAYHILRNLKIRWLKTA